MIPIDWSRLPVELIQRLINICKHLRVMHLVCQGGQEFGHYYILTIARNLFDKLTVWIRNVWIHTLYIEYMLHSCTLVNSQYLALIEWNVVDRWLCRLILDNKNTSLKMYYNVLACRLPSFVSIHTHITTKRWKITKDLKLKKWKKFELWYLVHVFG